MYLIQNNVRRAIFTKHEKGTTQGGTKDGTQTHTNSDLLKLPSLVFNTNFKRRLP